MTRNKNIGHDGKRRELTAGLLAIWSFQLVWGPIWKLLKNRQMIRQNEALDVSFSKMLITGRFKVTEGQKFQKTAFLNTSVLKNISLWTQACFEKITYFFDICNFAIWCLPVTFNRENDLKMSFLGSNTPGEIVISCLRAIFNFRYFAL